MSNQTNMDHETEFEIPMCGHGNIILGCPYDDCVEQNAYVAKGQDALDSYNDELILNARKWVRQELGLPDDSEEYAEFLNKERLELNNKRLK